MSSNIDKFKDSVATKDDVIDQHDVDKKEKRKIAKNIAVISCAFMFLFTAFQSLSNLQSSLNKDEGLGLASLCVIYAALIISCMFVPPLMINRLGCKWTVAMAMSCYVLYTAANYYSSWYTLIPASIILGFAAAPLWSAKCSYLTTTGIRYAQIGGVESDDDVVTRFFGVFFMIFQSGQIWGNLISSLILKPTGDASKNDITKCGANYCPSIAVAVAVNTSNATAAISGVASKSTVFTLLSIYLAVGILAVILVVTMLEKITVLGSEKRDNGVCSLFIATLRHLKERRMQLLIILTMFSGLEQGFVFGDYTNAFVTCSLGIEKVGFVMICFGVTDALCSFGLGKLSEYTGRPILMFSGAAVNLGLIIMLLAWQLNREYVAMYYVTAAGWGFCDAIWQTQVNAFYGHLFPTNQEAAFSNYRLWESLGFVIAFAVGNYMCVRAKLYMLIAFLLTGIAGYGMIEIIHRRTSKEFSVSMEELEAKHS
eukprot:gene14408-15909_t